MKKRNSSTNKRKPVSRKQRSVSVRGSRRSFSPHAQKPESLAVQAGQTGESQVSAAPSFKLESKPRRYRLMMGTVIVLGITSIYFYVDILLKLHNYYTLLFVIPLYGYVFGDLVLWARSGVRSLELDSAGLRIVLPDPRPVRRVALSEIGSVRISSSLDGKIVHILLHGAKVSKFLWMNFYSGPRFRIPESPFDKKEFAEFIQRITSVAPASR